MACSASRSCDVHMSSVGTRGRRQRCCEGQLGRVSLEHAICRTRHVCAARSAGTQPCTATPSHSHHPSPLCNQEEKAKSIPVHESFVEAKVHVSTSWRAFKEALTKRCDPHSHPHIVRQGVIHFPLAPSTGKSHPQASPNDGADCAPRARCHHGHHPCVFLQGGNVER